MKRTNFKRLFAGVLLGVCAVLCGFGIYSPQTDIKQAKADTYAETEFRLASVSLNLYSYETQPKCRLTLYLPEATINNLKETKTVAGEQIYPYSLHIFTDKNTSKIHGEDIRNGFVSTTLIYSNPDSSEFKKSNIDAFVKENDVYVKTLNMSNGSFSENMVSRTPEGYSYINVDLDLPLPYNYEHTFYCVLSETQSYMFSGTGNFSKNNVGALYVTGAKNILKRNISSLAQSLLDKEGSNYSAAQLAELQKIANADGSVNNSVTDNAQSPTTTMRKTLGILGGVIILALIAVLPFLGVRQKTNVNVSVGERNVSGGKVKRKDK